MESHKPPLDKDLEREIKRLSPPGYTLWSNEVEMTMEEDTSLTPVMLPTEMKSKPMVNISEDLKSPVSERKTVVDMSKDSKSTAPELIKRNSTYISLKKDGYDSNIGDDTGNIDDKNSDTGLGMYIDCEGEDSGNEMDNEVEDYNVKKGDKFNAKDNNNNDYKGGPKEMNKIHMKKDVSQKQDYVDKEKYKKHNRETSDEQDMNRNKEMEVSSNKRQYHIFDDVKDVLEDIHATIHFTVNTKPLNETNAPSSNVAPVSTFPQMPMYPPFVAPYMFSSQPNYTLCSPYPFYNQHYQPFPCHVPFNCFNILPSYYPLYGNDMFNNAPSSHQRIQVPFNFHKQKQQQRHSTPNQPNNHYSKQQDQQWNREQEENSQHQLHHHQQQQQQQQQQEGDHPRQQQQHHHHQQQQQQQQQWNQDRYFHQSYFQPYNNNYNNNNNVNNDGGYARGNMKNKIKEKRKYYAY
nr:MAG: hypothetical protein [Marsupenaeus japonicus endogenous nimavirus]